MSVASWRGGGKGGDASTTFPHRCTGGSIWRLNTLGLKDSSLSSRNRWLSGTFGSTGRSGDRKLLTSAASVDRRQPVCFAGLPGSIPSLSRSEYDEELAMSGENLRYERVYIVMNAFITME